MVLIVYGFPKMVANDLHFPQHRLGGKKECSINKKWDLAYLASGVIKRGWLENPTWRV
jgi:hypothetical protein